MGTADHISDVAAEGFGAGAAAYEKGRPSYADDVVEWLVGRLGIATGRQVVDLAAGTGKLTRLLAATGADVTAIEPVDAMRDQLVAVCPDIDALSGTAESIPLPDRSVDAITVAQAFHWFEPAIALAEIARVLRPSGALGIVFNERDTREPWVADLSKLIRWDERERWRVPYTVEVDWAAVVAEHGPQFQPADRYDSTYIQPMDPDTLVQRVLSTSYIARLPTAEQSALADRVRDLVAPMGPSFELPYVTVAYAFPLR